jgi:protoheme IX farnesyltransferase
MKSDVLALSGSRSRAVDFLVLSKPRLNLLVVLSAMAGYYLGAGNSVDLIVLAHTVLGTALVAAAASAFNQVAERDLDARMDRTRLRPLPDGRLSAGDALWFGVAAALVGLVALAVGANLLAAAVALATLVSYVFVYTPLKRRTPLATVVGAVPGALPPMIGWAAAREALPLPAWVLFGIVFLWQMPHFLAIAWMYRDEYARAAIPLLPVIEPDGRSTGRQVILYSTALVPFSALPAVTGLAGPIYVAGAFVLGAMLLALGCRFAGSRTAADARRLFLGSIIYLPLLWILMIADRNGSW